MANTQSIPSTWEAEPERSRAWGLHITRSSHHITSQWLHITGEHQPVTEPVSETKASFPAEYLRLSSVLPMHPYTHAQACSVHTRAYRNTYAMTGKTHYTHIHMTDKIFITIGYLFILCMCMGEGTCIHHGAFTEVGGGLAKVSSLLLPCNRTRFSGLTRAEPSH